jgi:hypothetical protein
MEQTLPGHCQHGNVTLLFMFARAIARFGPPLSSLFTNPGQTSSLRSRPSFVHRSSNRRRAIFRRSRTVYSLARSRDAARRGC